MSRIRITVYNRVSAHLIELGIDWKIKEPIIADAVALVGLDKERCWLFKRSDIDRYAQQHPPGKYHFFLYVDRSVNILKDRLCFVHEFDEFLIENNFKSVFV